jgi:hypothetical protein
MELDYFKSIWKFEFTNSGALWTIKFSLKFFRINWSQFRPHFQNGKCSPQLVIQVFKSAKILELGKYLFYGFKQNYHSWASWVTPERPNTIIPFGCLPTTASSEPPPPSSAASSHELPPPPTSRAPHRSGAPHRPLRHCRATTGPFSRRRLSSAQARRRGEPLCGESLLLDAPAIGPPPRRVTLAATPTPLAAGKLSDLGGFAIARQGVPCFGRGLPARGGLGQMVGLARFGPMEQFLAISRN